MLLLLLEVVELLSGLGVAIVVGFKRHHHRNLQRGSAATGGAAGTTAHYRQLTVTETEEEEERVGSKDVEEEQWTCSASASYRRNGRTPAPPRPQSACSMSPEYYLRCLLTHLI